MTQLNKAYKIHTLASDLGLKPSAKPVSDILQYCERIARKFLKEFPACAAPAQLLEILATRLRTRFEIINNDDDLREIQQRYLEAGEKGFATLEEDLDDDVFGITFRRQARKPWEPDYVSVIDARGDKSFRANYTKWHELGHLFILTDQLRLAFTRTSCTQDLKDPEESLVDAIAGHFAFWPPIFGPHVSGGVSFDAIERIRLQVCPEASKASTLLGLVRLWPSPCLLVEARLRLKENERVAQTQGAFSFRDMPKPSLRVVSVTANDSAQEQGLRVHRQWRVPERSIIRELFDSRQSHGTANEDLSWWETSSGSRLRPTRVHVEAKLNGDSVQALITPLD